MKDGIISKLEITTRNNSGHLSMIKMKVTSGKELVINAVKRHYESVTMKIVKALNETIQKRLDISRNQRIKVIEMLNLNIQDASKSKQFGCSM